MTNLVDIEESIRKAANKPALARELFGMLMGELPERLQQIKQAHAAGDIDTLYEHAHKLYGATAYCGVPALQQCSAELDSYSKNRELDRLPETVSATVKIIEQMLVECQVLLEDEWE